MATDHLDRQVALGEGLEVDPGRKPKNCIADSLARLNFAHCRLEMWGKTVEAARRWRSHYCTGASSVNCTDMLGKRWPDCWGLGSSIPAVVGGCTRSGKGECNCEMIMEATYARMGKFLEPPPPMSDDGLEVDWVHMPDRGDTVDPCWEGKVAI